MADLIRYYFDQHIQSAVTQGLRLRGVDVLTAQEAGRCGLQDSDQFQFAASEDRVMVTFDPDYLVFAAGGLNHAGLTWCSATKYSIGELIQMLILVYGVFDRDQMRNHVEYL